jgi:hypothetical protein
MEFQQKDKLVLLFEETSNLIQDSNKISKEKINKLDSTLNNKLSLVRNIIKDRNLDIKKFKSWINTINKNEKEIRQYTSQFEEISQKLEKTLSLNQFECSVQGNAVNGLYNTMNLLRTIQIKEQKQKKDLEEIISSPMNSFSLAENIKNIVKFYENITGIRIEKDKNENDTLIVHAFEGYNLLNDLKSCDFSIKLKNGKFHIIKMNPMFNPKPYEDEINGENMKEKNLGVILGKIILNEFRQYVIT